MPSVRLRSSKLAAAAATTTLRGDNNNNNLCTYTARAAAPFDFGAIFHSIQCAPSPAQSLREPDTDLSSFLREPFGRRK